MSIIQVPTIKIYEVGGFVRDELLGIKSKDRDCTVVIDYPEFTADQAFDYMRSWLISERYEIFVESSEYFTIRAHPPARDGLTADFVLARKEGPYSDGRRPDWVEVGTLEDDLNRRDFTVNALARDLDTGEIIDLHHGQEDLKSKMLKFVGDPMERITEDALRVMRAIRFSVTKNFWFATETWSAICHDAVPDLLSRISEERREQELKIMFKNGDNATAVKLLANLPPELLEAIFSGRVRLTSTLKS